MALLRWLILYWLLLPLVGAAGPTTPPPSNRPYLTDPSVEKLKEIAIKEFVWPPCSVVRGVKSRRLCIHRFYLYRELDVVQLDMDVSNRGDYVDAAFSQAAALENATLNNQSALIHSMLRNLKPKVRSVPYRIADC